MHSRLLSSVVNSRTIESAYLTFKADFDILILYKTVCSVAKQMRTELGLAQGLAYDHFVAADATPMAPTLLGRAPRTKQLLLGTSNLKATCFK